MMLKSVQYDTNGKLIALDHAKFILVCPRVFCSFHTTATAAEYCLYHGFIAIEFRI